MSLLALGLLDRTNGRKVGQQVKQIQFNSFNTTKPTPSFSTPYLTPANFSTKSAVIGIMSYSKNFDRRTLSRETYQRVAKEGTNIDIVFVMGTKGMPQELYDMVHTERNFFGDLCLLSHWPDDRTYNFMTAYKVMSFYAWALHSSRNYDYILKGDHDTYVHPFNMQRFLASSDTTKWSAQYYEDKATGIWTTIALTALNKGVKNISQYEMDHPEGTILESLKPGVNMWSATTADWYNSAIAHTHAKWDAMLAKNVTPDMCQFNLEAQQGVPPLSTVVLQKA
eukprot:gene21670-28687_t